MLNILGRSHDHGFDEPLELLADCHRRVEKFLDVLCRLARERNGGPLGPGEAEAILGAQRYFAHAAPRHTADEEESLFPRMKAAAEATGRVCPAIVGLQDDHARAEQMHARVDVLLSDWLRDGSLAGDRAQVVPRPHLCGGNSGVPAGRGTPLRGGPVERRIGNAGAPRASGAGVIGRACRGLSLGNRGWQVRRSRAAAVSP
jgi:hypothetical protein